MEISERQLEDFIWQAYHQKNGDKILLDRGLPMSGYLLRQFNMGSLGIPDLISFDVKEVNGFNSPVITIYELKKTVVDFSTLDQALRYKRGLRDILENLHGVEFQEGDYGWKNIYFEIVLIGSKVDEGIGFARHYLSPDISTYEYHFDPFNGLSFEEVSYTGYKKNASSIVRNPLPDKDLLSNWFRCHREMRDFDFGHISF